MCVMFRVILADILYIYIVVSPESSPGFKGWTSVKWCDFLNSPDCPACSHTSLYPLRLYIQHVWSSCEDISESWWSLKISTVPDFSEQFFCVCVCVCVCFGFYWITNRSFHVQGLFFNEYKSWCSLSLSVLSSEPVSRRLTSTSTTAHHPESSLHRPLLH